MFGRSEKTIKINRTVDILKRQTTDSVQNTSFLFIERTFSTEQSRKF